MHNRLDTMRTRVQFIVILFWLITYICNSQTNKVKIIVEEKLPFLDSIQNLAIKEKDLIELDKGCFVEYTTKGQQSLNALINDSTKFDKLQVAKLLIQILTRDSYYHLHNFAGETLSKKEMPDLVQGEIKNSSKSNYIQLRLNHSYEMVLKSGGDFYDLEFEQQKGLLKIISENGEREQTQKYFIEALYSLTAKKQNGDKIHNEIEKRIKSKVIKEYNDSLYNTFKKLKPTFEKLDTIKTWMEMDKCIADIKKLFQDSHPIMFFQILSQNPSTVLGSKELSSLKQKALMSIINNSDSSSFYSTYRLVYLNELLLNGNYTVRFLNTIMKSNEKSEFIKQLENK